MGYWDDSSLQTSAASPSAALRGRPLRYVLTHLLQNNEGQLTVQELIAGCESLGVVFDGRASKLISDALRWELRWGRVVRLRRGVYEFGSAPRSTMWRIRKRVGQYLGQLADLALLRSEQASELHPIPAPELTGLEDSRVQALISTVLLQ